VTSNNLGNAGLAKPFGVQNGLTLSQWGGGLASQLNTINGLVGTGTSYVGNQFGITGGTGFNPFATAPDASNWYGGSTNITTTGLGSTARFYLATSNGQGNGNPASIGAIFNATLTSSGLTLSNLTAVPLPAALWLLGSGLLGLAGVARRKIESV
jgi:hypothetical protein